MRLASLFLGLLTSAFCSEPARVIGLVVSIQGDWADSSGTPVEKGYAVWSNSTLRISGRAQQGDGIRVRSFVNGEAIVFDCGKISVEIRSISAKLHVEGRPAHRVCSSTRSA
jgi:hypothetical protein